MSAPPAEHDGVFVVVPAFNEAAVIRDVVVGLLGSFGEVVVVDDGSSDGTGRQLLDLDVTLLTHAINVGQGAALQTGLTHALSRGALAIVTFDADGQHRVEDAVRMVRELPAGDADALLGSRFLGGTVNIPLSRRLALKLAVRLDAMRHGIRLTDAHNGLRVLTRKAAEAVQIRQAGMAHASEIVDQLVSAGMRIREVPVTIEYTAYSLRKGQSLANAVDILVDLLVRRFQK